MLINCPECNHKISDKAKKCPHCGYRPKKIYVKLCVGLGVLIVLVGVGFAGSKWYQNIVEIKQDGNIAEYGEDIDLLDYIKYDKDKIKDVKVVNDGNFNSNCVGEYKIVYRATNVYNNSKEFSFNVVVKDTVAPKLHLEKKKVYLAKGADFDINEYAIGEDKSNVEVKYTGDLNTKKAGDYKISVVATDDSDNSSEPQELEINVSDRSKADFRNAFFGDDAETIKRYETAEFDSVNSTKSVLIFKGVSIGGVSCVAVYLLNKKGQFFSAHYSDDDYDGVVKGWKAIDDYNVWCKMLKKKYGVPNSCNKNILTSLYYYADSDSDALELGYIQYWTEYKRKNVIISCYADTLDYRTSAVLRYKSTKYSDDNDFGEI